MFKAIRLKSVSLTLIFSFILFYSPYLLTGQTEQTKGKGNLIGKVYGKDGTTVIEGAIVNIRNVATRTVYKSSKTDMLGTFKIEGIEEGLYSVGIVTKEGNFNVESLVGIKANETAKVTFALKSYSKGEVKKAEVRGKILEKAKAASKIAKFFSSPIGIAIVVAASVAIVYGVVTPAAAEEEVSPFRK
ncbi:MAG: carboxypeptidase regulatory-like domain-containing protein [Candidatus Aminicenantes bacterium]|nr:carboxypeptidase regulatory-like domain-containing protein [Candidatus Aminicenantes bacterium]